MKKLAGDTPLYRLQITLKLLLFAVIVCGLLLVPACGDKTPALKRLSIDGVVVAFGDSLTYGTGAKKDESYPAQLEKLTGLQVINEGRPGELSAEGKQRLPSVLDKYQPELLILCHGGNDMLRKKSKKAIAENLSAMIAEARDRGIQVVLIGVPEPALFLLNSAPFYEQVAMAEKTPIDSITLPKIESDNNLKSDTIHPNAAGYRILAEGIARLLKTTGAIP